MTQDKKGSVFWSVSYSCNEGTMLNFLLDVYNPSFYKPGPQREGMITMFTTEENMNEAGRVQLVKHDIK